MTEEKKPTTAKADKATAKKPASKKATTTSKKAVKAPYEKKEKKEVILQFKKHEKDTGSTRVQIALITDRINSLTEHLKTHKKDNHSRFGLIKLTGQRRKLLSYLNKKSTEEYAEVIKELGLRR